MEIPFIVNARKDTGLFNSKVGIWLFLASEVTLFGGLFSGYLFLRLYADYPWPERALPVLPGLINTFILIGSSVTVVFAWAALKMREWAKFQIYMGITLVCAFLFLGLKAVEYNAKLHHQAVRLTGDGSVQDFGYLEGHVHYAKLVDDKLVEVTKEEKKENDKKDDPEHIFAANKIIFKATELSFVLKRPAHEAYVKEILEQAGEDHTIILVDDYRVLDVDELHEGQKSRVELLKSERALVIKGGEALSIEILDDMEDAFLDARAHDKDIRTEFSRASWRWVRDEKGIKDIGNLVITKDYWKERMAEDAAKIAPLMLIDSGIKSAPGSVTFKIDPPLTLVMDPSDIPKITEDPTLGDTIRFRDDTTVKGKLLPSPMLMGIDAIDFRHTAMRAEIEGIDPLDAIKESWILTHTDSHGGNDLKKAWDCHMAWLKIETKRLLDKSDKKGRKKGDELVPTENDKYRINWDQMVAYEKLKYDPEAVVAAIEDKTLYHTSLFDLSGFAGANHTAHHFPHVEIPREKVGFTSTFTPKWNTYYAIYFTITGLHGLHVIGGIVVLGYYMFFGRKMYDSNPEWLANRVEIGGLFWHFVDLVWIFLFPILYLM
ncbi:MAG: heme/copper-type cytochrome/quinol oxidase subunit 3 [Paracoccaceae bacterium]|jgi:heme/copper-type cytochrome/quinol oxidase subunit 3